MLPCPLSGMPQVSVVMPCYNSEAYLGAAIDSVLGQTLGDLELIVVDDASTDASRAVAARRRDPRLRVEALPVNGGYPAAMNVGLALARGRYVARMDADDVCRPTRLAAQLALLEADPRLVLVGTEWYFVTPGGRIHERHPPRPDGTPRVQAESWQSLYDGTRRFNDPSAMARLAAVRAVGGYRTYQRSVQDLDLWFRLVEAGGGAASWLEPLYGRRLNPDSLVYSGERALFDAVPRALALERRQGGADAVARGESVVPAAGRGERREAARRTAQGLLKAAGVCAAAGDPPGERRFLRRALATAGLSPLGAAAAWRLARSRLPS